MKIKTQDLTGAALDWAVAVACAYRPLLTGDFQVPRSDERKVCVMSNDLGIKVYNVFPVVFAPGVRWSQGGPIVDLEDIDILWDDREDGGHEFGARLGRMRPHPTRHTMSYFSMRGPTKLIAAMRCFVVSKLGDEVDVPEELLC